MSILAKHIMVVGLSGVQFGRPKVIASDKQNLLDERKLQIQYVFVNNDYRQNWVTQSPIIIK